MNGKLLIPLIAGLLTAPLSVASHQIASAQTPAKAKVRVEPASLEMFATPSEYARILAVYNTDRSVGIPYKAEPGSRLDGSLVRPEDPQQSAWRVEDGRWTDSQGRDMPYRHGNSDFGYVKASQKHNLLDVNVVNATVRGGNIKNNDDGRAGPTYIGEIFYRENPEVVIQIVVGGTFSHYSFSLKENSPDNRAVGVITAYCTPVNKDQPEKTQKCPDWVNAF